ncbi:efflux RND transporter periplasmic adaptor subunit [Pendulispora albinea]|uniref:Efflux RND transporter periplasmic adaptor subunit n=1 Tax=Pendulispora albinea TaxID=2741071 RepID=A0ABZ2LQM1_9BACT
MSARPFSPLRRRVLALLAVAGGFALVARFQDRDGRAAAIDHYTCSMHPSVKQPGPGKCPICGMNLVPVAKDTKDASNAKNAKDAKDAKDPQASTVTLDDSRRQLIGVRTAPVTVGPMRTTFRAAGRVAYDESRLADVNPRVRGWITRLMASQPGQPVGKGQPLFEMYSPESYNAQHDLLLALQASNAPLVHAARQRLRLLGMDDAQIDAMAKKGAPAESITVLSPASGFIAEKNAVEGASIEPGTRVFRIAALDRVWIEANVYEADLVHVRVGQPVEVILDHAPDRTYDAKVASIDPSLDAKARTGRVRVTVANRDLALRPEMYATVELGADMGTRLQVPSAAVVYTGPRRLVFLDRGEGRFEPRAIRIGAEAHGMYEVLSGLQAGDSVAVSGVFLIAAEARIRTAAAYWENASDAGDEP